jgi:ATP-binding cassette, subfamily B, bacterial
MVIQMNEFWKLWRKRVRAIRNIPPVLGIVWESAPGIVTGGLVCRIISSLVPIAMLAVSKWIVDALVAAHKGQPIPWFFWWLVGTEFALGALGAVLSRATGFFDTVLADRMTKHIAVKIMRHASKLDLASFEDPAFHDKLERARVQATDRLSTIHEIGTAIQQVVLALSFSISLFVFSPWLLLLLILCVVPAFLAESHYAFVGYSLNFRQTPVRRQMDYLRILGASKESAKELRLFGLGDFITGEFERLSNEIHRDNVSLARRRFSAVSLLAVVSSAGYYGVYAWVIYVTMKGELSIGTMTFLTGAIAGASTSIQGVFTLFSSVADQALFLTDLLDFFATRPRISSKPDALRMPRPIREGFVFENVSFAYPGSERQILNGLNLRLEPDTRVALIGENGQGKTTIVKLLTRLYDPTAGRILLDGVDLREYDIEDLQREVGVIFQDFMRYEMTVRHNIGVGDIQRTNDAAGIELAAAKSMADVVVGRLDGGMEQMLGRRFVGGVDLSGGEWQKIALARAYFRDAQVLILDEPTAALDAIAEYEVFERFADLTAGKIALLISHRFSTVRMATRIVVLADGKIVEEGNHEQLMSLGNKYAEMFELQAANYR